MFEPNIIQGSVNRLHLLLGDQLDVDSPILEGLDRETDAILMMEVEAESRHVVTHFQRTIFFLSAMRHAALALGSRGYRVEYVCLDDPRNRGSFGEEMKRAVKRLQPQFLTVARPGSFRVLDAIRTAADEMGHSLTVLEDPHFLLTPAEFAEWASGRRSLSMGHFYSWMRKRLDLLMDNGKPIGGKWSFDTSNRGAFKREPKPPDPGLRVEDPIAQEVLEIVRSRLPDLAGEVALPLWPVTREGAVLQLERFVRERLPEFGQWQDAMWTGHDFLWHSHLSPALNVKLLHPMEVVEAAVNAYEVGHAPIESVEGFVRQIVGWREFTRGIYWKEGRAYRNRNRLGARQGLPSAYWDAKSSMRCLAESIRPVLQYGYSHHIQRLMVTGTYAMMSDCSPSAVRDWYLGMFVDGVDWVTTPNVIGMSQWADGGILGSKPYAASGRYVNRMSNYCHECEYSPSEKSGETACPMTTLYWSFLEKHRPDFEQNPRMKMVLRNLDRIPKADRNAVKRRRKQLAMG